MLRAVRNTPLRRCLHTLAPAARQTRSRRLALAGAASAAAVTYIAWKATFQTNNIALDSHRQPTASSKSKPKSHVEPLEPTAEPELKAQISHPPEESDEPPEGEAGNEGEQESGASSAFNPDTGEINWDCPCLGGMAHGPCGPHFREAFSCFVFSEQDPKGIDCVEKFKAMQDCFREHPELYGEEIADDDDDDEQASAPSDPATPATTLTKEPPSQIPNTL